MWEYRHNERSVPAFFFLSVNILVNLRKARSRIRAVQDTCNHGIGPSLYCYNPIAVMSRRVKRASAMRTAFRYFGPGTATPLLLRNVLSDIQRDRDVDDDAKGNPLCIRVDTQELKCSFQEFEDCNTDDCR